MDVVDTAAGQMPGWVNFVVADTDATQRNAGWAGQIFDVHMIDLLMRISF
jgi:hypothetical protein